MRLYQCPACWLLPDGRTVENDASVRRRKPLSALIEDVRTELLRAISRYN